MFYKTSHYLIYTTKTIPCSHKKKTTPSPYYKKKKKLSKKKSHYTHESRMMTLLYILYKRNDMSTTFLQHFYNKS